MNVFKSTANHHEVIMLKLIKQCCKNNDLGKIIKWFNLRNDDDNTYSNELLSFKTEKDSFVILLRNIKYDGKTHKIEYDWYRGESDEESESDEEDEEEPCDRCGNPSTAGLINDEFLCVECRELTLV